MPKGLNYTYRLDIGEAVKNAETIRKKMLEVHDAAVQTGKGFQSANSVLKKALTESSAASEKLRIENLALDASYKAGKITLQQLTEREKQLRIERLEHVKAAREAKAAQVAANGSYNEASQRLKALGIAIKSASGGFSSANPIIRQQIREYNELNTKLKQFDATMGNHGRNVGNYQSALNGLRGLASTYLGGAAILAAGQKVIANNAELSDSLSDVRRTAGLTAKEADNLAEQLKKIDTRTSLKGLLDIATIGGQVGIAKEQLVGFTTAVDQLAVSLGSELTGGAEGIAKTLGVLDNVFGVTVANGGNVEKSFNQIGSAILGLGQSGLATGDFLTDFGQRVGGVAKQAGLSLPVILSYGAVLQESGVSAEVAGSSFNRLLSSLASNREKFYSVAKIADANLTIKDFTNLINTDAQRALQLFFAGLEKGGTTTTSFNDILKSLRLQGAGVSQTVAALSGHQTELNTHIREATSDFDAATKSAEQFQLKNDNLAGSIDKLGNVLVKHTTSGTIGNFFKGFVDWIRISLDEFGKMVNSSSWKEFWSRLSNNGGDVYELVSGFEKTSRNTSANQKFLYPSGVTPESMEKKLFEKGEDFNRRYVANLKKTMDEAGEILKRYEEGVKKGTLKEGGITIAQYRQNFQMAKTYYEDVSKLQSKFGYGPKATASKKGDGPTAQIGKPADAERKKLEAALDAQRSLQAKLEDVAKKARNKALSDDAQEIEDVKDKYAKLRAEAVTFNDDPVNKKRGLKVDASGLAISQSIEIDTVLAKQATEKSKKSLDELSKKYQEYEEFKTNFGIAKAEERYKNEIRTGKTYLETLKEMETRILSRQKGKGGDQDDPTASEKAELKVVQERIKEEETLERKKNDTLLKDLMGYQKQRELLIERYNVNKNKYAEGSEERLELDRLHKESLAKLDDQNVEKLDAFKNLFEGIEHLSGEAAKKVIADAESMLNKLVDKGLISAKLAADIRKALTASGDALAKRLPERLVALGSELNNLAGAVGDIGDGFGKWISTVGNVVGSVGQLKLQFASFEKLDQKDVFGKLSGGIGMFTTALSIGKAFASLLGGEARRRDEQAKYSSDLQLKQTEAITKALDRQLELINQVYGTEKITKYAEAIKGIGTATEDVTKQLSGMLKLTGDTALDALIAKINSGQTNGLSLSEQLLLSKNKDLLNSLKVPINDLKELESLLGSNLLDEKTAQLARTLLDLKKKSEDAANAIKEQLTGTSFSSFADGIIEMFANASTSAEDFAKNFEDIMKKAILNSFKTKAIASELQKFYDQFAQFSESGNKLTSEEIATLKSQYDKIIAEGKAKFDELEKVTGVSFTDGSSKASPNSLQGAYATASQESITLLAGQTSGMRIAQLQTNAILTPIRDSIGQFSRIMLDQFDEAKKIEANTLRTANNTEDLKDIKTAIVSLNNKVGNGSNAAAAAGFTI